MCLATVNLYLVDFPDLKTMAQDPQLSGGHLQFCPFYSLMASSRMPAIMSGSIDTTNSWIRKL